MNKYLSEKYALLGTKKTKNNKLFETVKGIVKNPVLHFVIFVAIFWIMSDTMKMQDKTSFAITFSYAIAAIGFCLLMGYSGLASLGTGGFIGIGVFSVQYIMNEAELPFLLAILVAFVIAVAIGMIVGFISLRIEGIYLCILTLCLSEILREIYNVLEYTVNISKFELLGIEITRQNLICVVLVALLAVMILTHNLINSPTGRAMLAMKNSTAAAQAMGISLIKYRLLAFVLCTAFASLAGVMLLLSRRSISADTAGAYALITSLNILAAVIIGGYKSIWGSVFGCYIMFGLNNLLNEITFFKENPEIISFFTGILVILVVMFYPGGLAQLLLELKTKAKQIYKKVKEGIYGKDLG